jgi:hypothetical protein
MVLTPEQVTELKEQLSEQIKHLPPEQRELAQKQINEMSAEALELMLKQQQPKKSQKGIFRMLIDSDIPTKKVDENKEVIAIVSKAAISRGHVLIIPKKPVLDAKQIPNSAFSLAKKIAKKVSSKLKPKSVEIQTEFAFGETIINVLPIYDTPVNINSPKYEASEKELGEVYNLLKVSKKTQIIKIKKKSTAQESLIKLKRRIP